MATSNQNSQNHHLQQIREDNQPTSSHNSDSSDSSYDFAADLNQKPLCKRTPEEERELLMKYRGKHGLKYAKISNEQRLKLIKQVTTTGCTIKSAAKELNINFSTAKAIMQIYRKEGRSSKKLKRENKKIFSPNHEVENQTIPKHQNYTDQGLTKVEVTQENLDTNLFQQAEETNRSQAILIQQLNTQNYYLQGRVNQLQQEKIQISQNYQYLLQQYNQLQQMVQNYQASYILQRSQPL